jgi:hypothetical protein
LALTDGFALDVPRDVTVMVDAGAVFKMRKGRFIVGSSSPAVDRSGAALQILGTPQQEVFFTSYNDTQVGTMGTTGAADPDDSVAPDRIVQRDYPELRRGHVGRPRQLRRNAVQHAALPDFCRQRRVLHHLRTHRARDSRQSPCYQLGQCAGLNIRTPAGSTLRSMTVAGRFNDTDIVHVVNDNLILAGTPGGAFQETVALAVGVVITTPLNTVNGALPNGVYQYKLKSAPSVAFGTINLGLLNPSHDTIELTQRPIPTNAQKADGFVARRLYRSFNGGAFELVTQLNATDLLYTDRGSKLGGILHADPALPRRSRRVPSRRFRELPPRACTWSRLRPTIPSSTRSC